jgi:hypothetical protein
MICYGSTTLSLDKDDRTPEVVVKTYEYTSSTWLKVVIGEVSGGTFYVVGTREQIAAVVRSLAEAAHKVAMGFVFESMGGVR